jgi:hypothetical protein
MEEALWETGMELVKIFALLVGISLLVGAVIVVSWDVYHESERHRLLARAPRFAARGRMPSAGRIRSSLSCR